MRSASFAASAALLLLLTGCKPDAAIKEGTPVGDGRSSQPAAKAKAIDTATLGTITGQVHFKGAAPARVKIDMSQDPACTLKGGDNFTEQVLVQKGGLANVFVYLKPAPGLATTQDNAQAVVIDQQGCKFVPHVVAVAQGGTVQFTNSDPTMHNVHTMPVQVGNRSVDVSEGPGAKPEEVHFIAAETMIPIRCNNHPWMNAFVNVSPTPYFAVSATDGSFKLSGVPAGSYTLVFVHEKLGTHEEPVTVTAHSNTQVGTSF